MLAFGASACGGDGQGPVDGGADASTGDGGTDDGAMHDGATDDSSVTSDQGEDADVSVGPMLDVIDDFSTDEDESVDLVLDLAEVALGGDAVVTASSSDLGVIAAEGIVVTGSGTDRAITFTPVANASGSTTITLTVVVGEQTFDEAFVITVNPVDDAPTIGTIANVSVDEDGTTGPLGFMVAAIDADDEEADFTLTTSSTDGDVIPVGNVVFGGTGGSRTVTVTPAAGSSDLDPITITVTVTDDDGLMATTSFSVTVTAVDDAPTFTMVPEDQSMLEDGSSRVVDVGIDDGESPAADLDFTTVSSAPEVLAVTAGGAGATRTVTLDPQPNRFGTVTITLTVSDGSSSSMTTFGVTVAPVNDVPVLTTTATLPVEADEDSDTITIPFSASDVDIAGAFPPQTPTQTLSFSTTHSTNQPGLISGVNVVGSSVVISIAENGFGEGTVTLTATDDGTPPQSADLILSIRVLPSEDPPTITQVGTVTWNEDTATIVTFEVSDPDLTGQDLQVWSLASGAPFLLHSIDNMFGGPRTVQLTLTPVPNANGSGTVTVNATVDGLTITTMIFPVTVVPVNDPPTIHVLSVDPQTMTQNTTSGSITFRVADIDNGPCTLVVSSATSNAVLLPTRTFSPACSAMGNSAVRTLTVTSGANQTGSGTITLRTVDADGLFSSATFTVNVTP